MDEEQVEEMKEAFHEFDKNKDGRINGKELSGLMRFMGVILSDAEVMEVIRECGGSVDVTEQQWVQWMGKKTAENSSAEDLVKAFQVFDKDGNGLISISELRYVLCCVGDKLDDEAVEAMLSQADPSGCGSVRYEPFVRQMLQNSH